MKVPIVSVIIPVYKAVDFVEESVKSAVHFEIVGEIVLIEDGGNDGSYEKCLELCNEFSKVRLLIHPNHENRGVSASRNLGIIESRFPFIAFLDADDYFLPNRFNEFDTILKSKEPFDGIYEAIQYFNGIDKIYGVSRQVSPENLLFYLIRGTYGHFHTNGLIVKKELLLKANLFDESLLLHQDSDLWLKLAFYGRLISGIPDVPVSMVRKHEGNRIWNGTSAKSKYKQLIITWKWAKYEKVGFFNKLLLLRKLLKYRFNFILENE